MACRRGLQGACRLQMRRARITPARLLIGRLFLGRRSWAANWASKRAQTGVAADKGSTPYPWTGREQSTQRCDRAPTSPSTCPPCPPRGHVAAQVANQVPAFAASCALITNLAECEWEVWPRPGQSGALSSSSSLCKAWDCDDKVPHGANSCRSSRLGCVFPPCSEGPAPYW